jgi:hypothetical protein
MDGQLTNLSVKGIFMAYILRMLDAALQSSAQNLNLMLCTRVISGFNTGYLNPIVPSFAEEPPQLAMAARLSSSFSLPITSVLRSHTGSNSAFDIIPMNTSVGDSLLPFKLSSSLFYPSLSEHSPDLFVGSSQNIAMEKQSSPLEIP